MSIYKTWKNGKTLNIEDFGPGGYIDFVPIPDVVPSISVPLSKTMEVLAEVWSSAFWKAGKRNKEMIRKAGKTFILFIWCRPRVHILEPGSPHFNFKFAAFDLIPLFVPGNQRNNQRTGMTPAEFKRLHSNRSPWGN